MIEIKEEGEAVVEAEKEIETDIKQRSNNNRFNKNKIMVKSRKMNINRTKMTTKTMKKTMEIQTKIKNRILQHSSSNNHNLTKNQIDIYLQ